MLMLLFTLVIGVLLLDGCSAPEQPQKEKAEGATEKKKQKEEDELKLSEVAQKEMLTLARKAIQTATSINEKRPHIGIRDLIEEVRRIVLKDYNPPDELKRKHGIFVTLRKNGDLRGCIGTFRADEPLYELAVEFAVNSGFGDPRFGRLSAAELTSVNIEISVLSPLRKVESPDEVIVGKHGIEVVRGWRRGCFLPEVATDFNMSREEFLSNCCSHKAGLPADAWRDPATEIYVFTTFKFKEK